MPFLRSALLYRLGQMDTNSLRYDEEARLENFNLQLYLVVSLDPMISAAMCREHIRHRLHVLVEEVEQQLIRLLVIRLDSLVVQITTSCHESVHLCQTLVFCLYGGDQHSTYLVGEPLHDVLDLDSLGPLLDILFWLILARKHGERNCDAWCIVLVDHGWVARGSGLEWSARLRGEVDNLASPACVEQVSSVHTRTRWKVRILQ